MHFLSLSFYYYYGPTFFQPAGTNLSSLEVQLMLGGVSLAATIPALWALDKIGRRKMLFQVGFVEAHCDSRLDKADLCLIIGCNP